jgi:hypothetical protein
MKTLIAFAGLLALGATAHANFAPAKLQPVAISVNEWAIETGPSGAMLESDYFRAPQQPLTAGRIFPCRLQVYTSRRRDLPNRATETGLKLVGRVDVAGRYSNWHTVFFYPLTGE